MKTLQKTLMLLALVPVLFLTSCKDTEEVKPDAFETLTAYLLENSLDVSDVINGWITAAPSTAEEVAAFTSNYSILDIRSADAFAAGHIEGAVNSSFETLLADAKNAQKPILVVCYTGQTASHAVLALRLSGHIDAKVLMWGMSGWNSATMAPWNGSIADHGVGNANWSTGAVAADTKFGTPVIETTKTDGAEILAERVQLLLSNGFAGINATDVLAAPGDFFINNYWAATDTDHYGHIAGAHRIQPLTLAGEEYLKLDPEATIVSYCWTGQTSAMLTGYLNVLGYNAKSLKFGANGMIYNSLESHKYAPPSVDLPVVTN